MRVISLAIFKKSLIKKASSLLSLNKKPCHACFLTGHTGIKVAQAFVDMGYRNHGLEDVDVFHSRQRRGITKTIKRHLKRRQAIEPIIGHRILPGGLRDLAGQS